MTPTIPASSYAPNGHKGYKHNGRPDLYLQISPLARAALDNGVSFQDVEAYINGALPGADADELGAYSARWYEACNLPEGDVTTPALAAYVTEMVTDTLLEGALVRSVLAEGTIEHARLWWRGVL